MEVILLTQFYVLDLIKFVNGKYENDIYVRPDVLEKCFVAKSLKIAC